MALEVNRPYPPNTLLRFRFTLPGERERMEGEAAVRWTRAQGNDAYAIGVEFVTLSGAHRKRVKSFIERTESPA